jgi:hypothetical protein
VVGSTVTKDCESLTNYPSTYQAWLDKFELIHDNPTRLRDACPNCGHDEIHLVYADVDEQTMIGQAAFWCDYCLVGISLGRSKARTEFEIQPRSSSTAVRAIPNYRVVPPTVTTDGDEEYLEAPLPVTDTAGEP